MKYTAFLIVPVRWEMTVEADSEEDAEREAERLIDDKTWCDSVEAKINDKPVEDILWEEVEVEEVVPAED